jgi:hypothetical protein
VVRGQTLLRQFEKVLQDRQLPFNGISVILPDTRNTFKCLLPIGFGLAFPKSEFSDISFAEKHPDYGN